MLLPHSDKKISLPIGMKHPVPNSFYHSVFSHGPEDDTFGLTSRHKREIQSTIIFRSFSIKNNSCLETDVFRISNFNGMGMKHNNRISAI